MPAHRISRARPLGMADLRAPGSEELHELSIRADRLPDVIVCGQQVAHAPGFAVGPARPDRLALVAPELVVARVHALLGEVEVGVDVGHPRHQDAHDVRQPRLSRALVVLRHRAGIPGQLGPQRAAVAGDEPEAVALRIDPAGPIIDTPGAERVLGGRVLGIEEQAPVGLPGDEVAARVEAAHVECREVVGGEHCPAVRARDLPGLVEDVALEGPQAADIIRGLPALRAALGLVDAHGAVDGRAGGQRPELLVTQRQVAGPLLADVRPSVIGPPLPECGGLIGLAQIWPLGGNRHCGATEQGKSSQYSAGIQCQSHLSVTRRGEGPHEGAAEPYSLRLRSAHGNPTSGPTSLVPQTPATLARAAFMKNGVNSRFHLR